MNLEFEHNIEYLLAIISAILGMSLPIMLQVIERIDQKYKSSRLAERLKREPAIRFCKWSLVTALVACAYTVFFRIDSLVNCWIINNSSNLIALLCCLALVCTFLWSCVVILNYYNPEKLQKKIIDALNKAKTGSEKRQNELLDFVDLSKTILEVSDREPAYLIYDVLRKEIKTVIENANEDGMIIPDYLANNITSINENICLMKRRPYSVNNGNQLLLELISNPTKLSDSSYRLLWKNLLLQLHYNADEPVYEYWTGAVQIFDLNLHRIIAGAYNPEGETTYTQEDVNRRLSQRQRFLEFHVVICSYILHLNKYNLLDKLLGYTQTIPPTYPLIPSSMSEIIAMFRHIDVSPRFEMNDEQYYSFLGMKGIVDGEIRGAVKRYLSLLFLRMFSPIGIAADFSLSLPDNLKDLKKYDSYLDSLKWLVAKIKENNELYTLVKPANDQTNPEDVIDNRKKEIKEKIKNIRENAPLDDQLIIENKAELKEFVKRGLSPYNALSDDNGKLTAYAHYWITCNVSCPYPNAAFMRNSDRGYSGMAENIGEIIVRRFKQSIASLFFRARKEKELRIRNSDIFNALDKLQISEKHVIIAFGIYWDYYINAKQAGLIKKGDYSYSYKGVNIINLPTDALRLVEQTLYVLRRDDMPSLSFVETPQEQRVLFQLEEIDTQLKLYMSLLQLSHHENIAAIVQKDLVDLDLNDKTLFSAFLTAHIAWSKHIPLVQIKLLYNLGDNGRSEEIDGITAFERMANDISVVAQRSETLAITEIEKELDIRLSQDEIGLDGVGEKDGKTIYVEVKYVSSSMNSFDKVLDRAIHGFNRRPRNDNYVFYILLVSDKPIPVEKKKEIEMQVEEKDINIRVRFYSLYQ